jgi:hypothetical protein
VPGTSSFASCPRISYSRPLTSSSIAVRAVSGESAPQGLPIDLRGKQCQEFVVVATWYFYACKEKKSVISQSSSNCNFVWVLLVCVIIHTDLLW